MPELNVAEWSFGRLYLSLSLLVSVLIVGMSYGARNVLSYHSMIQNFLAVRDSPIIPLRRLPSACLSV